MDEVDPVDAAGMAAASAAADLARVQAKVAAARAVLAQLLQEVVRAEGRLDDDRAAELLAANEQLVLSALHDQTMAAQATQVLARVAHAAERDALTRLPNRVLLIDRFARALAAARRSGGRVALLFLDLDNFKQVNDTLGHAVGDGVLKDVAHRLVTAVREADTVSRHGGDEFLVLLTDVTQPDDAARIADKLLRALADSRAASGAVHPLQASIGISVYPDDGDDIDLLIHRADLAMYRAKREGGGGWAFHHNAAPPG
ncbi:MAG: GGDEF domain-containing protein [Betaproteobacteria bacterium]|nr:GGDEF domain-containing protein [Betaproteobacteria bacterium]